MPRSIWRCCSPGDTILGMSLAHGGHLTHGAKVNFSGKMFNAVQYGVDVNTGLIDYAEVERLALEHKPKMMSPASRPIRRWSTGRACRDRRSRSAPICSSTWRMSPAWLPPACIRIRCRMPTWSPRPRTRPCAARAAASSCRQGECRDREEAAVDGLPRHPGRSADARHRGQGGGLQGSPAAGVQGLPAAGRAERAGDGEHLIARGYKIVSGGTQNHLFLVDLIGRDVTGKDAEAALGAAHITVNKNAVPNDPRSPFVTSGLRIGTPAVTTRGYREPDCVALANWICDVLDNPNNENVIAGARANVTKQCRQFPVYA
jgi:glycine hydroxymethyltransferase